MKLLTFIQMLLFTYTAFAQDSIIVKNDEHVIYYKTTNESLILTIEDIKDNEENFIVANNSMGDEVRYGSAMMSGKNQDKLRDVAYIEIDRNQNGIVDDNYDLGYCIPYNVKYDNFSYIHNDTKKFSVLHSTIVNPHYIRKHELNYLTYLRSADKFLLNHTSKSTGNGEWRSSNYKTSPHPIWTFSFPYNELVSIDNLKLYVRFLIMRVSSEWGNDYYGPFYYPNINQINDSRFDSYKIDLTKTIIGQRLLNEKKQFIAQLQERKQKSNEKIAAASKDIPDWDGVYIKLLSGKFIELNALNFNRAGYLMSDNHFIKNGTIKLDIINQIVSTHRYFFFKGELDTDIRVIEIKKRDFKGVFLVASNFSSTQVSNANFSKYDLITLKSDGSEMLFPLRNSQRPSSGDMIGNCITRTPIYLNNVLKTRRASLENNSFLYVPETLENGYYSFWIEGTKLFMFEIVD